jgi:hypothetical protein
MNNKDATVFTNKEDFDSRNSVVYATPSTSIIEVRYLALHFRQLHNNSMGRYFSGKVVNNELTSKIP